METKVMVRCMVTFFKPSGKYYDEEYVLFPAEPEDEYDDFRKYVEKHCSDGRMDGMIAVCLEPYVKHQYPRMIVVGEKGPVRRREEE